MNKLVLFPLILCVIQAISAADKQDVKAKSTSSPTNTIPQSPKYEMIFQPLKFQQPQLQYQFQAIQPQQKAQYIPVQLIPKPYYVPQPQPQAMIIIAQPALVPQSLLYSNPTQQLLNYFHSNPQAKYQLLHGNYQPQTQVQTQPQPQSTATYMQPVLTTAPGVNLFTPQVQQYTTQQPQVQQVQQVQVQTQPQAQAQTQTQTHTQQPLSSLAHLAQLAAQHYISTQMKTAPAIVTGFEHFTPEQQAQIKAQLSTHLGSNFHAISNSSPNQYSSKYVANQPESFIPSPQVQNEQVTTVTSQQNVDLLKTRFGNKNKN